MGSITSSEATRGHGFSHKPSHCVFPKELSAAAADPVFPGCGLWTQPRGHDGREICRVGLASPLGDAVGSNIWPVGLSVNCSWPLCCLQAKLGATELYRETERERWGGVVGGLLLTLPHFSLFQQQLPL